MRIFAILAAGVFATGAFAQSQELIDAATAYADSPTQTKLINDMLSPEGVMAQMGLSGGQLTTEQQQKVAVIVSDELDKIKPQMREAMIMGMANTFTLEEIAALSEFYASPVGASAMTKMNPFMQQTMAALGPAFQSMQTNLGTRIPQALSE